MSLALHLFRLQQVDSRLKQVLIRLSAIQSALDNNAEVQSASKCLDEVKNSQRKAEIDLKNVEFEANTQRIKLEQVEANLYSGHIQNPKEMQDIQKEIVALKKNLSSLEDMQLENMILVETFHNEVIKAQNDYEIIQGKVISENAGLKNEQLVLQKECETLNAQRLAILPVIDRASIDLYDHLRQKKSGLAVSLVKENACEVCGSSLTPGFAQSVRSSNQLILCPMCGRILYSN